MAESSSVTHSVATVVASDNDYGKDGDVTYSIECEYRFMFLFHVSKFICVLNKVVR